MRKMLAGENGNHFLHPMHGRLEVSEADERNAHKQKGNPLFAPYAYRATRSTLHSFWLPKHMGTPCFSGRILKDSYFNGRFGKKRCQSSSC